MRVCCPKCSKEVELDLMSNNVLCDSCGKYHGGVAMLVNDAALPYGRFFNFYGLVCRIATVAGMIAIAGTFDMGFFMVLQTSVIMTAAVMALWTGYVVVAYLRLMLQAARCDHSHDPKLEVHELAR